MVADLLIFGIIILLGLVIIDWLDGASKWERDQHERRH